MAAGSVLLDLAGKDREHQNLDGGTCGIPKWTCDTIRVCDLFKLAIDDQMEKNTDRRALQ